VNTRLQVEHPVTEQVTGLDLVKLQIAIAAGHRLPFAWETITPRGNAMEVRLYAEDPDNNFFPSPGKILSRQVPAGPGIRLDDGVYDGWTVPNDYDPLLAKLIAWGNSREETIARLRRALEESTITGIKTNVGLFRRLLTEPDFLKGDVHTKWLDELLAKDHAAKSAATRNTAKTTATTAEKKVAPSRESVTNPDARPATATSVTANSASDAAIANSDAAAIAAALFQAGETTRNSSSSNPTPEAQHDSRWKLEGRRAQLDRTP
jgi:acetyl-CoA carboxylase, biotin carboxylase subunit